MASVLVAAFTSGRPWPRTGASMWGSAGMSMFDVRESWRPSGQSKTLASASPPLSPTSMIQAPPMAWWEDLEELRRRRPVDLGKATYGARGTVTDGVTTFPMFVGVDIKSSGAALAVIGILPLNEAWSLDARAGAADCGSVTGTIRFQAGHAQTPEIGSQTTSDQRGVDYASAHCRARLPTSQLGDSDAQRR